LLFGRDKNDEASTRFGCAVALVLAKRVSVKSIEGLLIVTPDLFRVPPLSMLIKASFVPKVLR
jgi:hypothetical protein